MIHEFTPADRQTVLFKKLSDSITKKLAQLREKNDAAHDEATTSHMRGQIAILKEFQNDMKEKPAPAPAQNRNPYQ